MPGVSSSTSDQLRRDDSGISRWNSPEMVTLLIGAEVSTIGESAVTVTFSARELSCSVTLMVNVAPARTTMPAR